jgi:hypothetical protein
MGLYASEKLLSTPISVTQPSITTMPIKTPNKPIAGGTDFMERNCFMGGNNKYPAVGQENLYWLRYCEKTEYRQICSPKGVYPICK